jgi:hypothetical protein
LGEVTIQAYCALDAYINGFALQEKTVSFKTAEEAAVLAREEVRKFADLAEERQVAARADECLYPPKLWAAGGDEPVFLVDRGCVHAGAHLAPPGCRRLGVAGRRSTRKRAGRSPASWCARGGGWRR